MNVSKNSKIKVVYNTILCMFLCTIIFFGFTGIVNADTPYSLEMLAYKCDAPYLQSLDPEFLEYDFTNASIVAQVCQMAYENGAISTYQRTNGDEFEENDVILFVYRMAEIGTPADVTLFETHFEYDKRIFSPVYDSDSSSYIVLTPDATVKTSGYPGKETGFGSNKKFTGTWSIQAAVDTTNSNINITGSDNGNKLALTNAVDIAYILMQVNEGGSGNFKLDLASSGPFADQAVQLSQVVGATNDTLRGYTYTTPTFSVAGEELSDDNTLKSITFKDSNGTSYPMLPTLGSNNTNYTFYVPYEVSGGTLYAELNDATALFDGQAAGEDYSKNISGFAVGAGNVYSIGTASAKGTPKVYTITIKRLSNDASLQSITFTNGVGLDNFSPTKYTYETSVPYSITNTVVTATPASATSTVKTGNGSWSFNVLESDGDNERKITVEAENCKSDYASVPGNTCTSKDYTITVTRKDPSTNAYLKSLSIDGSSIVDKNNTSFSKTTYDYYLEYSASKDSITINASEEDTGKATLISSQLGNKTLSTGDQTFIVKVTAEDGVSYHEYKIHVYKKSNNKYLRRLTLTPNPTSTDAGVGMNSAFSRTTHSYTYNYAETLNTYTIQATVEDTDKAYVSIVDADNTSNTNNKPNAINTNQTTFSITETSKVNITVTSENGESEIYTITMARVKSTDNTLKVLDVTTNETSYTLTPAFTPTTSTRTFTLEVEPEIDTVSINAIPTSVYASIDSIKNTTTNVTSTNGSVGLNFGLNKITVVVKAENKATQTYNVEITRKKYVDSKLSAITVQDTAGNTYQLSPAFDPGVTEYALTDDIPYNIKSLSITGTAHDTYYGSVTNAGNKSIDVGDNTLTITGVAHNTTTTDYHISVTRLGNPDNKLTNLKVANVAATLVTEDEDTSNYTVTVPNTVSAIYPSDITYTLPLGATTSPSQTIDPLDTDVNGHEYVFDVISESGKTRAYIIKVIREKSSEKGISLVTLTIGTDSSRQCVPNATTHACSIEVPSNTTQFNLTASIPSTAYIYPVNGTTHTMAASEPSKEIILTVTAEDTTIQTYTITINRIKSSIKTLSNIELNGTNLATFTNNEVVFNSGTNSYTIDVPSDMSSISIKGTATDTGKAKVDVTDQLSGYTVGGTLNEEEDTYTLNYGNNTYRIYVVAEDNTSAYYTVVINRAKKNNSKLRYLRVNGTDVPNWNANVLEYYLDTQDNSVTSLVITAEAQDKAPAGADPSEYATVGGAGVQTLNTGSNLFEITVTAHNGTQSIYKIHVDRKKSNDVSILGMTVAGVIATKQDTRNYTVTVPNSVDTISLSNLFLQLPVPNEGSNPATYKIVSSDYSTDLTEVPLYTEDDKPNNIVVKVTAEDGLTSEYYNLKVTRAKSNVATLHSLNIYDTENSIIGSYSIKAFVPDTFTPDTGSDNIMSYEITVPVETTDYVIKVVTTEGHAKVEPSAAAGAGVRYTLPAGSNGSEVEQRVIVTSEDLNVTNIYRIIIKRAKSGINSLDSITVTTPNNPGVTPTWDKTFKSNIVSYNISVPGDVETIRLGAVLTDSRAHVDDAENILTNHNLNVGNNPFEIKVIAENDSPNSYMLNITRAAKPYKDLGYVKLGDTVLLDTENSINEFNSSNSYTFSDSVGYDVTSLPIVVTPKDGDATYKVTVTDTKGNVTNISDNNVLLSTGNNIIKITVTAQDSTTKDYTINLTRDKNNVATIRTITVLKTKGNNNEIINTIPGEFNYSFEVDETKETIKASDIIVELDDASATKVITPATLTLEPSSPTNYPNKVTITVTAEDGETTETYTLSIRRPLSSNSYLSSVDLRDTNGNVTASISPTFSNLTTEYTITIPVNADSFTIKGIPELPTTTVTGNNTYTYNLDENKVPYLTYMDGDTEVRIDSVTENGVTKVQFYLTGVAQNNSTTPYLFNVISAKSQDTLLSDLVVQDQTFTTSDGKYHAGTGVDNKNYTIKNSIDMDQDSLKIIATPRNAKATYVCILDDVTYDCKNELIPLPNIAGTKTITVRVTSASGTKTEDYTIKYTKEKSTDAFLESLSATNPSGLTIAFSKAKQTYTINVPNDVESVDFEYELSDVKASASIEGVKQAPTTTGGKVFTYTKEGLAVGNNTLRIDTLAENEATSYYYIVTIVRANPVASNDAFLQSLSVTDTVADSPIALNKAFDKTDNNYSIGEIEYKLDTLTINAVPNYSKSTIKYNVDGVGQQSNVVTLPRSEGEHYINIIVIAEDNRTTNTYTIKYTKTASTNNRVTSIVLDNATINFTESQKKYEVEVERAITSMTATVRIEDPRATVMINGQTTEPLITTPISYTLSPLYAGLNVIQVTVTSESGSINVYEIKITRESDPDKIITSHQYGHTIQSGLIKTVVLDTTVGDLIVGELDNPKEYLQVWNHDDNTRIGENEKLGTGMIVKLIIDGEEFDRDEIVIKGDTNGDGKITINDSVKIVNHFLNTSPLTGAYLAAADTNGDTRITINDSVKIVNHFLNVTPLFN